MKVKVKSYSPRKGKESQQLENDERDSSRDNNPVCIWNRSNAECKIEMWELGSRRSPKGLKSQRHNFMAHSCSTSSWAWSAKDRINETICNYTCLLVLVLVCISSRLTTLLHAVVGLLLSAALSPFLCFQLVGGSRCARPIVTVAHSFIVIFIKVR